MIKKIEKITSVHQGVSKLGKIFSRKHTRTIYHIICDICGRKLTRSKGEAYKIEERNKHVCSRECIGKLTMLKRWKNHVPQRSRRKTGYIYIGNKREHQLIAEKMLGRSLQKGEIVHHIDGDKGNNSVNNLYVCENIQEHNRIHGQLEALAFLLYQKNKIIFNKNNAIYEWSK